MSNRPPAVRPHFRWPVALAAALLVAAACGESSPQGPAADAGGPASVSVTATIEAAGGPASQQAGSGGLGAAFDAADVAAVRVTGPGGSALADREVGFDPGSGGAELSLELTIEDDRVPATVELALRRGADRLFEGSTGLTLVAGETATAELGLDPVAAAVSVPEGPVTFTALGDSARLDASVVFSTGDTIPGLAVTWSSSDAAVVDVSEDGTLVADAPGTAEAVAAHEGLSASVAVEVDPEVATVAVEPDAATFTSLSGTEAFSVQVTDANGNALTDEPVTWSSTDVQVAAVDGSGLAEARGDGAALVVAEAMGTADTASVTVDLGPTGRVAGQVGRVQPPASSSSTAASASSSSADGSSVGAAITTNPAGGVEVRFLQGGEVVSRTTTAADGSWTSPAIPPGTYTLEYASPDLVTVRHEGVEIGEGTTGSVAEVPMVPASDQPGTVAGTAVNSRDGSGVAGATVELRPGIDNPDGPVVATGTAGADGGYEITGVEPGTYTITGTAPDFAPDEITGVALGGETFGGQDLTLVPPPAVTIGSPTHGASFTTADVIPFRGSADDPEQGTLTGDALVWTSDQAGEIGTGESFTASLAAGEHTITLTATNDRGASGEASVEITVVAGDAGGQLPTRLYVTDELTGDLWVVDPSTNTVVGQVPVGSNPRPVAVRGNAGPAYAGLSSFPGQVAVVDIASNAVTGSISVPNPRDIAFSPDGATAYVASRGELSNLTIIDVASGSVTGNVPMPNGPEGLAVTPDGSSVYVSNAFSDEVEVVGTGFNAVVDVVAVGENPGQMAVAPDGSEVYVADTDPNVAEQGAQVSVIDVATNTVTSTIGLFGVTHDVAVTPDGSRLYVVVTSPDEVQVVDVASGQQVDTVNLPGSFPDPRRIAISADGSTAYVTLSATGEVAVVDLSTNTVTTTIAVGSGPFGITIND